MSEAFCLVIPCFNEADRLPWGAIEQLPANSRCLFVNDGSTDSTAALLRQRLSHTIQLLDLPVNRGKAEAVRQGMLHARASGLLEGVDWVGYWDADMSTPLDEVPRFVRYAGMSERSVDAIFGSRIYKLGSSIARSGRRHLLGRVFATLAAGMLDVHCYDSQCGAKLFRSDLVEPLFSEPFISRWIFDLEILLRLRGRVVTEYPLQTWKDVRGSKMNVVRQAWPTLVDLTRIRKRYVTGDAVRRAADHEAPLVPPARSA